MRLSNVVRALHRHVHAAASPGSINASEIAHFSRLSSQWWNEQGEFSFLHKMNPVRVQFIREKLLQVSREEKGEEASSSTKILRGLDVLDVGCGGGLLSESLARLGANTTGIDASESNVAIAKLHASTDPKLDHLSYVHAPAETLLASPKRYDVVCSMEVLEHVDNPASFLSTCAELLKPGGHLFLSTISRTPISYFLTILLAEDILRRVSQGTHTYSKFVNPSELVSFFQKYCSPSSTQSESLEASGTSQLSSPWISPHASPNAPTRTEAEVRGLIYNPLRARWILAPRDAWAATDCNYIFWIRKPY
ncbi:Ubiquinone biosynthesis O-methyltransferase [Hypsizygus marmoreus]|uniref:Ubiquinone biosynthesis O-methyltransferase, mitochondrial n=1 Tax=Hypsizygus marmoreus TaxID=39966 RepID=A0A369K459_HYPMA|nr:Ubiquinone biosynthesis O-methyltransferase [Hypsizygus marmoreus]